MANFLYDKAREKFLKGELSWSNDDIKVVLVSSAYTPVQNEHTSLANIPSNARVAISGNLTSKTTLNGVAGAGDVVFSAVPVDKQVQAFVIYKDNAINEADKQLIAYIDTASGALPTTTTTSEFKIFWNSGANKIFKL